MASFSFGVFDFATADDFSRGPRTGNPTKLPVADVANGLVPGDPATPEQTNGLFNVIGTALTYLKTLPDVAVTWTLRQLFDAGLTSGGALLASGDAATSRYEALVGDNTAWVECLKVRISGVSAGYARLCVQRVTAGSGKTLNFALTINAEPRLVSSNPGWAKDRAGQGALILRGSANGTAPGRLTVAAKPLESDAPWTDTYDTASPTGWSVSVLSLYGEGDATASKLWRSLTVAGTVVATLIDAAAVQTADLDVVGDAAITGELTADTIVTGTTLEVGTDLVVGNNSSVGDSEVRGNEVIAGSLEVGTDLDVLDDLTVAGNIRHGSVAWAWAEISNRGAAFNVLGAFGCTVARNGAGSDYIDVTFDTAAPNDTYMAMITCLPVAPGTKQGIVMREIPETTHVVFSIFNPVTGLRLDLNDADSDFDIQILVMVNP